MILTRKRLRAAKKQHQLFDSDASMELNANIPIHFLCPISLDLMKDPVTLTSGVTYDRDSIETWLDSGKTTCPVTKQALINLEPIPNHALRKMIQDWCVENRSLGVERIPTPRFPITSDEVSRILSLLDDARMRADAEKCRKMVLKIKTLAKESERNKGCFVADNRIIEVLSTTFNSISTWEFVDERYLPLLEEILSVLVSMLPHFDEEKRLQLATSSALSLHCIVWFMRSGDSLSARRNAVLALKTILCEDRNKIDELMNIEGALEALVKLIKDPVSHNTTKASLLIMYYMVKPSDDAQSLPKAIMVVKRFTQLGLVELLLEMLVDSERRTCEKALGVLDGLCSYGEGRESAYENALSVPILVKKLIGVSDLASSFAVSVLRKLAENEKRDDGGMIVELLEAGAFQKLLMLLQVGCDEDCKKKTTQLLKLLHDCRNKVECIESFDFRILLNTCVRAVNEGKVRIKIRFFWKRLIITC